MRFALGAATVLAIALVCGADAHAEPPPARRGFQIGLRTGVAFPFGTARGGAQFLHTGAGGVYGVSRLAMSDVTGWQIPLLVDVGAKVSPYVHLGGYLGLALGRGEECTSYWSCTAVSVRVGIALQYHGRPSARLDPWFGYGVGVESLSVGHRDASFCDSSFRMAGIEFGHLMAGLDVRMSRGIGLGPFVDASVGEYFRQSDAIAGCATGLVQSAYPNGNVQSPDLHYWVTVGPRVIFLP